MCGIVGYTGHNLEVVRRAHALQSHRGPDDAGFYSDAHVSLGHNRLAIIDLDHRSAQPMWDTQHQLCVVFNGEIYNFQTLKDELRSTYEFRTQSDTEVLLALYKKYGFDMCAHLRGMYAFAIYDSGSGTVFLARDAFGIKPLYYSYQNGALYFASEMKAMVSMFGATNISLELDQESLQVYLTLGYTIAPRTIYKHISLLEPGMTLRFDTRTKATPTRQRSSMHATAESRTIEEVVRNQILSNLVADVPVGIFFSGGTDSSLIAAVLHAQGVNLETFSVAVSGRSADAYYFKKIAEELKLKQNVFAFDAGAFDEIYHEVVSRLDNPSGTDSIFQTYFIARKAQGTAKVVLLGDGGDELFGGYPRSFPLATMDGTSLRRGLWLENLYFALPRFRAKNFLFLHLFRWFGSPVSYYLNAMSALRDAGDIAAWRICRAHIAARNIPPSQFDLSLYLGEGLLLKNDAATSYCSIEGRVPLLDIDTLARHRGQMRLSAAKHETKYSLKKMLAAYVPREYVYRKKSGFGVSYRTILSESKYLAADHKAAWHDLHAMGITLPAEAEVARKYPHYSVLLTSLWYCLKNNSRIYDTARKASVNTTTQR